MRNSLLAKWLLSLLLALPLAAWAQPSCFSPPVDPAGKGAVHGTTGGVEWSAWWCEVKFDWVLAHWYRLPGYAVITPPVGASGVKDYAAAVWRANVGANSCYTNPHPAGRPACAAMQIAAEASKPLPIFYNVNVATATNGTRPGYRLNAGTLTTDGIRHLAGAWCECWRGAVKAGSAQYCLVTNTESYAACVRQP